ncbi:MAG: redoxin domain-containing protein [Bacteroidia bacterium]
MNAMWTGLLAALLMFSCQDAGNQTQEPAAQNTAVSETSEASAPTTTPAPAITSGTIKPPAGWPKYEGTDWKFNPNRANPVACNFSVKVTGADASKVQLIGVYGEQNYPAGDAQVQADGTAVFSKQGGYLSGFYYVLFKDNTAIPLVLNKDQEFSITIGNKADISGTAKVEGSIDNELYHEMARYEKQIAPELNALGAQQQGKKPSEQVWKDARVKQMKLINGKMAKLRKMRKDHPDAFFPVFKLAGQNPNPNPPLLATGDIDNAMYGAMYRNAFWSDVDFGDVRLLRSPVLHNKLKRYITELTPQSIDSVIKSIDVVSQRSLGDPEVYKHVINWIGTEYKESKIMGGQAIFLHIVDNYFTDELAYWDKPANLEKLRDKVEETRYSLIGMQGQNVTTNDINGVQRSLYDLKGEILVVFMYSPNCEHCREAAPELLEIYNKWHDKGLDIYGICTETELEPLKKFVEKYKFPWWNVMDPTYKSYYMKYHVDITPEIYVLDKDRKIIAKDLKPFQLEEVLERELGN